ncbi:MAG: sugar phosphate isomerase/epimerase [Chitinophagaceae bacterium]
MLKAIMNKKSTINRRSFLLQSAVLLPGAFLARDFVLQSNASKYKMGLQLFSIREPLSKDVTGTVKKIAAVGYEDCETYGYDPVKGSYYGLKAADFKKLLEDNGMISTSGHYDFSSLFDKSPDDMLQFVDQCIKGAHSLDQKYITWPWLDPKFRTIGHFHQLTEKLNRIGERVNKAGLGFAYHNHDFEFIDFNGENGYEIIMRDTDPSQVKLQMDIYWVMHSSKLSPAELFARQPGRFVMWHIKDMDKITRDYSELGNGSIDFTVILPEAPRAGLQYYYIEQGGNFAKDPMQSITDSAVYFKANLEKFLK